jgi:uncharacterized protein YkwD
MDRPSSARVPPRPGHLVRALLLATLLPACSTMGDAPEPISVRPHSAAALRRLEGELLARVNAARAAAHLPPLDRDPRLARAARAYSEELAGRGVLDHESPTPNRRTALERIRAAGARVGAWGENLARTPLGPDLAADSVVGGWMRSAGHRDNLLSPDFVLTGIGAARAADRQLYVVQIYAARPQVQGAAGVLPGPPDRFR